MGDSLEREKKLRNDVEKTKRKVEGDLKLSQEAVADLERNQKELENTLSRKDNELAAIASKIDDEALGAARTGKQTKELLARIDELEDDLKGESANRAKAEKTKQMLARDLEENSIQHEAVLSQLRKKHNDSVNEMSEQVD